MLSIHNLPPQPSAFVGRGKELAEISQLLANPACRLLTLVGPGGIGKTRLAIEAASQTVGDFAQGAYFVALAPLSAADSLLSAIAAALNIQFRDGTDPRQHLFDYLAERQMLLVLDNFEHLLDGGPELISAMLTAAPQLKLLVTSRERLLLVEEWVLELGGLDFPTSDAETDLDTYSAVQLFIQQAKHAVVDFRLSTKDRLAVIRICQMVEGMPLAIELAAASVYALSCDVIAGEIGRSLDILHTSLRNVAPRHRSMRAAFEPTWGRLPDAERAIFSKLSVFRGGFTREAAEVVAGATLGNLSGLMAKSLLQMDANGRYTIQELLRQYAEEQLNASPEACRQVWDRYSVFYADFIGKCWDDWRQDARSEILESIDTDIANVYAAFNRAVDQMKVKPVRNFLDVMCYFYFLNRGTLEGEAVLARAVRRIRARVDVSDQEQQTILALCLSGQAGCLWLLSRRVEAQQRLYEALAILRLLPHGPEIVSVLARLGGWDMDFAEGERRLEEALSIARELDDKQSRAKILLSLSAFAHIRGEHIQAKQYAEEALALGQEMNDSENVACTLSQLGRIVRSQGEYAKARHYVQKSLTIAKKIGGRNLFQYFAYCLGQIAYSEGTYGEAKALFEESLAYLQNEIAPEATVWVLGGLGRTHGMLGDYRESGRCLFEALKVAKGLPHLLTGLYVLEAVAELLAHIDQPERAAELGAFTLTHPYSERDTIDFALRLLARLERKLSPKVYAAAQERARTLDLDTELEKCDGFLRKLLDGSVSSLYLQSRQSPELLGERELEVLRLIATGFSNKEIATELVLTTNTVKWYVSEILSKLGVANRTQAGIRARELGIVT